jgi:CMP-N-acetylneuraminic acid synthetase
MKANGYTIVALLPMKAHSERVTGKNFKPFYGKPLFTWILRALLELDEVERVVINTDARKMLEEYPDVHNERVAIRDRRSEICGDFVSMNRIIEDDLNNVPADIYLMTHATNPLLSGATIRAALNTFRDAQKKGTADSLFTVNKYQTRFYRADGSAVNHNPERLERTQDLEPWFEENSNLYIFTKSSFQETQSRIGRRPILFEMSRVESVDIDDQESWNLAEFIAKATWPAGA